MHQSWCFLFIFLYYTSDGESCNRAQLDCLMQLYIYYFSNYSFTLLHLVRVFNLLGGLEQFLYGFTMEFAGVVNKQAIYLWSAFY